ncbi:cytochrome c oxidase assembly factor 4 homolog, mitochondrial-like [Tubulanus polymorphus]|uniref:cytochrome c oxidase assembly factor 4 homolog, mitochondrial-like n=1 Tax=Tubulanus polymorphus TaxID=672921 RepID=UPI003DA36C17
MAAPTGHNWDTAKKSLNDDDEDTDPVEEMIKKTGCLEKHYDVMECMADHRDWRICQTQVTAFKKCMADYHMKSIKKS